MSNPSDDLRFIRAPEVCRRTSLSKATIRRLERRGQFPRHHRISSHAIAWIAFDVDEWIRRQIAARHRAVAENEKLLNARDVRRAYLLLAPTLKGWVARNVVQPVLVDGEIRYSTREIERVLGIA
jgi:prophage regulatory protein